MSVTRERRRPESLVRLGQAPYRNAIVVMAIAVTMASLFAISYSLALGRPTPHHIPASVVGSPSEHLVLINALERATKNGLHLVPVASEAAAKREIEQQHVYAALLLNRSPVKLLLASAAGTSVARVLSEAATGAAVAAGKPLTVTDLHPLPAKDPQGLVSFYVTLAATILGFVTMFQLRANAKGLTVKAWLACILALAIAGGLTLALVTDPLIGALHGPFAELWAALAAQIAAAALFCATMLTLIGRWAMIPTWGLFVALGNASSGGAVAPPLLPTFYGLIGRLLPTGATVETIRNAVYFQDAQHLEPMIVEALWIGVALTALVIVARVRGHTPDSA